MRSACLSISLVFAALPFTHLLDLGYSFLSFEVWATSVLFFSVGAALAFAFARLGLLFLLSTGVLYAFVSVYFFSTAEIQPIILVAIVLPYLLLLRRFETAVLPVVATFAMIFSLSNVIVPKNTKTLRSGTVEARLADEERPKTALLHIVLDEEAPLNSGQGTDYARNAAAAIQRDYEVRGFTVYPTVRSLHRQTHKSLTNLVSLNGDTDNFVPIGRKGDHMVTVRDNVQFSNLIAEGFDIRVHQSSYLDFCGDSPGVECNTYRLRDMSVLEGSGLPYGDRLLTALLAIARDYSNEKGGRYVSGYRTVSQWIAPLNKSYRYLSWPGKSLEAMDDLRRGLASLQPGDAYFVHLLVPHFPYLYDAECQVKSPVDWVFPLRHGRQQSYEALERAYWDQTTCTHKKITQILDAVADRSYLTVMIHGDHGPRFFAGTETETEADKLDTYFAVRNSATGNREAPSGLGLHQVFTDEFQAFIARDDWVEITMQR